MTDSWHDAIGQERSKPYFQALMARIKDERAAGKVIYPPAPDVFNAFRQTPLADVKVVILGQDPYHGPNQAHGLAFSVRPGVAIPPSLANIYQELSQDVGFVRPNHGCLNAWAAQGVLLLNTVLTVEAGKAHSHARYGWETFTDKVVDVLSGQNRPIVFLLWGAHAQNKGARIERARHLVLTAPHPSPLSAHRGFLGCRHFSKTNAYLSEQGSTPIDWQI